MGLVAGATVAWPLAAEAQQPTKIARIGYLASNLTNQSPLEAFRQGLRDLGYDEGRNVVIEYRDAQGKLEPLQALAAELVALKVDVIVACGALTIKVDDLEHASAGTMIECARCSSPRGTVAALHELAKRGKPQLYEF